MISIIFLQYQSFINNKIIKNFYSKDEIDELKRKAKPECKICVDLGADRVLSCGHLLCKLCYDKCTETDIYCLDITGPFLRKFRVWKLDEYRNPKISSVCGTQLYPSSKILSVLSTQRYPSFEISSVPGIQRYPNFQNFVGYRPVPLYP